MKKKQEEVVLFWFRRDLRLDDNTGLYHALASGYPVLPVFLFDKEILARFDSPYNRQVEFIHRQVDILDRALRSHNSGLRMEHTTPASFFEKIIREYHIKGVYANEDYELTARKRDNAILGLLKENGIPFFLYKDQVIFSKDEVIKEDGHPYVVFTPYSRKWKEAFDPDKIPRFFTHTLTKNYLRTGSAEKSISLESLGYRKTGIRFPEATVPDKLLLEYDRLRDYPAKDGTSHLGVYLRFGTISIRELALRAAGLSHTFLNELVWRDFYFSITWHYPHISEGRAFKRDYDNIIWRNREDEFAAWCEGKTGYPIVDAGMRQLNSTGFMHNRLRMITASFLTKHLLIDWRWGETYFANKLLDFDFSANNGGWQWAAGSGCDAAPYFRIFNPILQAQKYDPDKVFIKQWVEEVDTKDYPAPIADHAKARERALNVYKQAMSS